MRGLRVVVLGLVSLSVLLGALSVRPVEAHTGTYRTIYNLNLRSGPGGSYEILDTMPRHRVVKARGHVGNWMKLTDLMTGTTGWAWLAYLEPYTPPLPAGGTGSGGGGSTSGYCMTNYWGEWVCASANVANAIRYWFGRYGISAWWGFAVSSCESSFSVYVVGWSGTYGLFQFRPSTFYWQGGVNLYDPWDQSRIAAKMMASGLGDHFYCAVLQGW